MRKFQVGDRVRFKQNYMGFIKGTIVTLVRVEDSQQDASEGGVGQLLRHTRELNRGFFSHRVELVESVKYYVRNETTGRLSTSDYDTLDAALAEAKRRAEVAKACYSVVTVSPVVVAKVIYHEPRFEVIDAVSSATS
jgi:hypothetical protein